MQKSRDKSDTVSLSSYDTRLRKNLSKDDRTSKTLRGSKDQVHTMEPSYKKSLGRNCVSLENLGVFVSEDNFSGNFPGYPVYPAYFYYNNPYHHQPQPMYLGYHNSYLANQNNPYITNSSSLGNSKQSIDDFRKYRDVAL